MVTCADPDRAVRLAHTITKNYFKARALANIARALAATDPDRAARLIADAERLAQSITSKAEKDDVFASLANAVAATDPDRAQRFVKLINGEVSKIWAFIAIAQA